MFKNGTAGQLAVSTSATFPVSSRRSLRRVLAAVIAIGVVAAAILAFIQLGRGSAERDAALQSARDGRFEEAEASLRRAIERNPRDSEVAEALARGSSKNGSDLAEADLDRWVDLQGNQFEPLQVRMDFYRKQKNAEKAFADGQRLRGLKPDDAALRRTVMNLAFSSGHYGEAEELCRELLKDQPRDVGLRSMLSEIRRARGDFAGAAAILDEMLAQQPQQASLLMLRAALFEETGQPEKAIPLLREVIKLDPKRQLSAGYQLGLALERVGQLEEAAKVMAEVRHQRDIEAAAEAIKSQPGNVELEVRLAETLIAAGQEEKGVTQLQNLVARDRTCAPAHAALAAYYEKRGDSKRAAEHRQRAGSR
jgi:predicted Zn-dependent protease